MGCEERGGGDDVGVLGGEEDVSAAVEVEGCEGF